MTKDLKQEVEDDVIPLEITGSVKVYNQAYVDEQKNRIEELEEISTRLESYYQNQKVQIEELEKKNKAVTRKADEAIADKLLITAKFNEILNDLNQEKDNLQKENAKLKRHIGLTVECEKAQKNGILCLGYGGDEDEPCEQCKNCIKCECGYYQLGETEKDEQLAKAKEIIKKFSEFVNSEIEYDPEHPEEHTKMWNELCAEAEQFISEVK